MDLPTGTPYREEGRKARRAKGGVGTTMRNGFYLFAFFACRRRSSSSFVTNHVWVPYISIYLVPAFGATKGKNGRGTVGGGASRWLRRF